MAIACRSTSGPVAGKLDEHNTMSTQSNETLAALRSAAEGIAAERYAGAANAAEAEQQAADAGDGQYLLARVRQLEAEREHASVQVPWLAPNHQGSAKDSLKRIGVICQAFPDLFSAMLVVLATHQGAPREALAATVRQLRPDAAELTQADIEGLMTSILNGARQSFDAVLRTRKSAKRPAAPLAWVKNDDQ
jgi:hypothetical protein